MKAKKKKETSKSIKDELEALRVLNKKRKSALEKMSKFILDEEDEIPDNEKKLPIKK